MCGLVMWLSLCCDFPFYLFLAFFSSSFLFSFIFLLSFSHLSFPYTISSIPPSLSLPLSPSLSLPLPPSPSLSLPLSLSPFSPSPPSIPLSLPLSLSLSPSLPLSLYSSIVSLLPVLMMALTVHSTMIQLIYGHSVPSLIVEAAIKMVSVIKSVTTPLAFMMGMTACLHSRPALHSKLHSIMFRGILIIVNYFSLCL